MALSATMACFKQCGLCCGFMAILNMWFWAGMTLFAIQGNTYLAFVFEGYELDADHEKSRWIMIYAVILGVSRQNFSFFFGISAHAYAYGHSLLVEPGLLSGLLRLHETRLLPRQRGRSVLWRTGWLCWRLRRPWPTTRQWQHRQWLR